MRVESPTPRNTRVRPRVFAHGYHSVVGGTGGAYITRDVLGVESSRWRRRLLLTTRGSMTEAGNL